MATASLKNGNDLEEDAKPRPYQPPSENSGMCDSTTRNSRIGRSDSDSGNFRIAGGATGNPRTDNRCGRIPSQQIEHGEVIKYHPAYPRNDFNDLLKPEDLYDIIIVYHKEDYDRVVEFKHWLQSLFEPAGLHDISIEFCDSEVFPPSHVCKVEDIVNRGMRVLLFLTPNFPTDKNLDFFAENAIHKSRLEYNTDGNKELETEIEKIMKYCLRPVHTEPSRTRVSKYKTPIGLGPIQGIDYFDKDKKYARVKAVELVKGARSDRNRLANLMERALYGVDKDYQHLQHQIHGMNQSSETRHQGVEQPTNCNPRELTSLEKRLHQGPSMSIKGKPVYFETTGLLPEGSVNAPVLMSPEECRNVGPAENVEANVINQSSATNGNVNNPWGISLDSPTINQTDVSNEAEPDSEVLYKRFSSLSSRSLEVDADQLGDHQDEITTSLQERQNVPLDVLNNEEKFINLDPEGKKTTIVYHKHYHYHGTEGQEEVSKERKTSESSQKNIYITGCNVVQVGPKGRIKATGLNREQNPQSSQSQEARNDNHIKGQQVYQGEEEESMVSSMDESFSTQPYSHGWVPSYSHGGSCDPSAYPQTTGELDQQPSSMATTECSVLTSQPMTSSSLYHQPLQVDLNSALFASRVDSTGPAVIQFSTTQTPISSQLPTDNDLFLDENLNDFPGDLAAELESFQFTVPSEETICSYRKPDYDVESQQVTEELILMKKSEEENNPKAEIEESQNIIQSTETIPHAQELNVVYSLVHGERQQSCYCYSTYLSLPFWCADSSPNSLTVPDNLGENDEELD